MGKSHVPPAPDPYVTSGAQTQSSTDIAAFNAALNRTSQFSPFGSQVWHQTGTDPHTGAPIWSETTQLSPQLQQLLGSAESSADASLAQPFNGDQARQDAQDAIYGRETSMLDPQYQQQQTALASQLAQQGITQGSAGWNAAQDNFARQRDFAYGQARDQAITGGQQELQTMMQLRDLPLQELGQLRQIVSNPTGAPAITAPTTDVAGNIWNAYQGNVNATSANNASANATDGEIASLAMMAAMYAY